MKKAQYDFMAEFTCPYCGKHCTADGLGAEYMEHDKQPFKCPRCEKEFLLTSE